MVGENEVVPLSRISHDRRNVDNHFFRNSDFSLLSRSIGVTFGEHRSIEQNQYLSHGKHIV